MPLTILVIPDTTDDTKQWDEGGTKTDERNNYNPLLKDIHPSLATCFSVVGMIRFTGDQNESEFSVVNYRVPVPYLSSKCNVSLRMLRMTVVVRYIYILLRYTDGDYVEVVHDFYTIL